MLRFAILALAATFPVSLTAAFPSDPTAALPSDPTAAFPSDPVLLNMPPRLMWGWSPPAPTSASGFCGSVSLQTVAIYFGNWLTTNYIRGTSGGYDAKHSLLIGYEKDLSPGTTSTAHACRVLRMNCSMWDYNTQRAPQHDNFLQWLEDAIGNGHPVITGLYWGVESSQDYDHIVPVVGFDSRHIYYNDLHSPTTIRASRTKFVANRKQCNSPRMFGSRSFCLPASIDYGMRVHGNLVSSTSCLCGSDRVE